MVTWETELKGRTAIVTGARGIGRAIALELASMGAAIVVVSQHRASAERTAGEVRALGNPSLAIAADVSRRDDVERMVGQALKEFGRVDVLVNDAGINLPCSPLEITEQFWDKIFGVNAKGLLWCCLAVIPSMLEAKQGIIINISSQSGKEARGTTGLVYGASKAAAISISRSLAMTYARDGIRVNCICPGSVETDMFASFDHEIGVIQMGLPPGEYTRRRAEQIPLGRLGKPEDIAGAVGFLASSKASWMTGQAINVTGGWITY